MQRGRSLSIDPDLDRPATSASFYRDLTWQDLQPLLLRSAGVIGFAGLAIAMLSSDVMFSRPQPAEASSATVIQEPTPDPVRLAASPAKTAATAPRLPAPSAATVAPRPASAPPSDSGPHLAAEPKALPPPAREVEPAKPVAKAEPPAPSMTAAVKPAALEASETEPAASLSSELAMLTGEAFLNGTVPPDYTLGSSAVLASPPRARPAVKVKAPAKSSQASGKRLTKPSGPPPKCKSKRARWRYVKGTPTWYCK